MNANTLEALNLSKTYKQKTVVKDISYKLQTGEIVGLLGPNGAGKTTSFYMTVGLVQNDAGQVLLDNENIAHLPIHSRARCGLGYLPQETSVFKKLTVHQNIMAILELRDDLSATQREEEAQSLLNEFHISHLADHKAISLSGGERRRVEIARALASNPRFLLLDEPFAGVDPLSITDIKNIIKQLAARNIGILITDHNVHETLAICDRAYIVHNGSVIAKGSTEEILANDQVRKVYLGDDFSL